MQIMNNIRNTKNRDKIISILKSHSLPLKLEEIHKLVTVSLPQTAFSTVFRIVSKLEESERVIRVDWRERGSHFEWADRPHHHHIVCQVCGKAADITSEVLDIDEKKVKSQTGFKVKEHFFELEGICEGCQNKLNSSQ